MTQTEASRLDALLEICEEDDCPLTPWEVDFIQSLDERRGLRLSEKQGEVFDRIVEKHLRGDE